MLVSVCARGRGGRQRGFGGVAGQAAPRLARRTRGGSSGSADLNSCFVMSSSMLAPVLTRCWMRRRRTCGGRRVSVP